VCICGPEVLFETCVGMTFVDDDDDDCKKVSKMSFNRRAPRCLHVTVSDVSQLTIVRIELHQQNHLLSGARFSKNLRTNLGKTLDKV